jgi:geranyl diphosphate 2-C-methyltransferase
LLFEKSDIKLSESMKKDRKGYFEDVGQYYNTHKEDLNFLLGEKDKIVHHHSGICKPNSVFPEMDEEQLLSILHKQETALTLRGIEQLGYLSPEMTGLDAGCGRGGSSFLINKLYGSKLCGVSLSSYQVDFANKTARELGVSDKVSFYQANMLQLPFDNKVFNFIWACESTEHIPNLSIMFTEFARVAKEGAKLVIIGGCSNPENPRAPELIKGINEWYHMLIHPTQEYLVAAQNTGWKPESNIDLTQETIPYWHLRERSTHKTGVERFVEGYECGAGEYRLFSFNLPKR